MRRGLCDLSRRLFLACLLGGVLLSALDAARAEDLNTRGEASKHAFQAALESIKSDDAQRHAAYLADDAFEGREAGSRGGRAAAVYLAKELRKLKLTGGGDGGGFYQVFDGRYRNVLALLEGGDPKLKNEVIVVGAHYDHVGYGSPRNSYGPIGYIHNGADDNASGAAGLLETIEAFVQLEPRPKRTILFAFWDGEEKGLLGSKHWVAHPTLPLSRVKALLNMDMIGRLRQRQVKVYGVRSAAGFRELTARAAQGMELWLDYTWEIKANSDHHPFYARGVPFLMLHTGLHDDYHRPRDDVEKLNMPGIQAVSRLCFRLASELANRPQTPQFRWQSRNETVEQQKAIERPTPPQPGRFGIRWTRDEGRAGIRLTRVTQDSAAAAGDLRPGDRLLKFNGRELNDDDRFKSWVLSAANPVTVTLARPGEEQRREVRIQLRGSPVRIGVAWREDEAEPGSVAITRVAPESPAAKAGLRPGDRIYEVASQRFATARRLRELLTRQVGTFDLLIDRQGRMGLVRIEVEDDEVTR